MSFLPLSLHLPRAPIAPLTPLRQWLNGFEVHQSWVAHWICYLVPNTCSSGYDLRILGRSWGHLPPLCQLNPLHEELLDLRFRAADFLYDQKTQS